MPQVFHAALDLLIAWPVGGSVSEAADDGEQAGTARPLKRGLLILRYSFIDILLHFGQEALVE